jgi:Fe2+ or Zn2+ uptake regulation protein
MNNLDITFHTDGLRITNQRKKIIDVLTPFPQGVLDIMGALAKKQIKIDKVTVYRTLDCFTRLGIITKTLFNDQTARYELITKHHHHHLVCNCCGKVKDFPFEDNYILKKVGKQTGFQIQSHTLEFFGVCGKCRKAKI